jgi:predicted alpha/beta superfamily hydrolase
MRPILIGFLFVSTLLSAQDAPCTVITDASNPRYVLLSNFQDGGLANGPRRVRLWLPPDYANGKSKYPVIYFSDGASIFHVSRPAEDGDKTLRADIAHDQLVALGEIRPALLVAVEPGPSNKGRWDELTPSKSSNMPGGGMLEGYYQFLKTKLKPYIDARYRTESGPADTGIAGFSLGGLAAFYLGWTHPETFGMAGCMSSSLWWDRRSFLESVFSNSTRKKSGRFWLDCGALENRSMIDPATLAARTLMRKGWVEGRDVALFFDHTGGHEWSSCAARTPGMLRFLLGKSPMALTGTAIKLLGDPAGKAIKLLSAGDGAFATLELQYAGGWRLTAAEPLLRMESAKVASLVETNFYLVENRGHGVSTLWASYGKWKSAQTVLGYGLEDLPKYERRVIPRLAEEPLLATTPSGQTHPGWPNADIAVDPADQSRQGGVVKARQRFGLAWGDAGLYLNLEVIDDTPVFATNKAPWSQDGVEIRIDARPDPVRSFAKGQGEFDRILLLALSPFEPGERPAAYRGKDLLTNLAWQCRRTEEGYALQMLVPTDWLNEKQQTNWREVRVNLCINSAESNGGAVAKHWWQPDWRTLANVPGSGTFRRD